MNKTLHNLDFPESFVMEDKLIVTFSEKFHKEEIQTYLNVKKGLLGSPLFNSYFNNSFILVRTPSNTSEFTSPNFFLTISFESV
jgi:hypothetical protein